MIDDVWWDVTVLGRAGSSAVGRASLLLLGFRLGDGEAGHAEDTASLEALVVGAELDGLGVEALRAAHATARPIRPKAPEPEHPHPPEGRFRRGPG